MSGLLYLAIYKNNLTEQDETLSRESIQIMYKYCRKVDFQIFDNFLTGKNFSHTYFQNFIEQSVLISDSESINPPPGKMTLSWEGGGKRKF